MTALLKFLGFGPRQTWIVAEMDADRYRRACERTAEAWNAGKIKF